LAYNLKDECDIDARRNSAQGDGTIGVLSCPLESRRRLQWAGHVSRMNFSRLTRMFLSSWVDHKRPQQRSQFNYGHGLLRHLRNPGGHLKAWDPPRGDPNLWHAITQQKNVDCIATQLEVVLLG
jgi:hypothetical protein